MQFRLLALCVWFLSAAVAQGPSAPVVKVNRDSGVQATTLQTENGTLTVNTPLLMEAGDRISGTVVAEPKGASAAEREKNLDVLNGIVIDVMGTSTSAKAKRFTAVVPAAAAVALRRAGGEMLGSAKVAQLPKGAFSGMEAAAPGEEHFVPAVATAGRPISVSGRFDGLMENTSAKMDGQPVQIVAESPHELVLDAPPDAAGPKKLEIQEHGGPAISQTVQLAKVSLQAQKLSLRRGEATTISATVAGLRGLPKQLHPIPLTVVNESPGTVSLQGGNQQTLKIEPGALNAAGAFVWKSRVTATQAGSFSVSARLGVAGAFYSFPGGWSSGMWGDDRDRPVDMDGVDRVGQLDNYSVRRLMDTLRDLRMRKRWDYVRGKEHQAWLAEKIRLVKGALRGNGVDVPDLPIDAADF
ncbi:MAG: hypothetical protein HY821_24560 [Acidobacteria bacterium]|nr:hypothetical protein [Acidobacteriota bacterium]